MLGVVDSARHEYYFGYTVAALYGREAKRDWTHAIELQFMQHLASGINTCLRPPRELTSSPHEILLAAEVLQARRSYPTKLIQLYTENQGHSILAPRAVLSICYKHYMAA